MISYKITKLDQASSQIMVRYSKENSPDYYVRRAVSNFNDTLIHETAKEAVEEAISHWNKLSTTTDFELTTDTGSLKEVVYEDEPSYNASTQKLVKSITETETTITEGWTVQDFTNDELANLIRSKRNVLLIESDSEMLSDRNPTSEMIAYRQALRDIPGQSGFPTDVTWPMKPIE